MDFSQYNQIIQKDPIWMEKRPATNATDAYTGNNNLQVIINQNKKIIELLESINFLLVSRLND